MKDINKLDEAILGSYKEYLNIKLLEERSIVDWISYSLNNLYTNNDVTGFLFEYQQELTMSKEDLYNMLSSKYLEIIQKIDTDEIHDFFKKNIKDTINNSGIEFGKETLKKYIETADATAFGISDDNSKISQYSSVGIINVMCRDYVENVIQNGKNQLQNIKKSSTIQKNKFYPYEFFVVGSSNQNFDIESLVSAMETIRNGKVEQ